MHILVTGANGFIGSHLVERLLREPGHLAPTRITVLDLSLDQLDDHMLIHKVKGSFADPEVLSTALAHPADMVFHLAAVPSGLAESNYEVGVNANILGTMALLERLRDQGNCPVVVFSSSIAVYGKPSVNEVDDDTLPTPNLTYGSQKVIGETLIADFSRRGWVSGCSVRLPGIVTRPPEPNGAVSIFFSDLIRNLSHGKPFTCPVSAEAKSWLMSVACVVDNLMLASSLKHDQRHTWTLPAMYVAIEELVNEIDELTPAFDARALITYEPDTWVEENFGSYPPINCPAAEAAGFHHDGSVQDLVKNSLDTNSTN